MSVTPEAVVRKEPKKERMPRVDQAKLLRRTFALDVFTLRLRHPGPLPCPRRACSWLSGRAVILRAAPPGLARS